MSATPAAPSVAPTHRRPSRERAHELLLEAATLDLRRAEWRVRCWYGSHNNWWTLDDARQLLMLANELWEEVAGGRRQLVVIDGLDLYRFDVT